MTSNPIELVYKDGQYCRDEICRIREAIGTIDATLKVFEAAEKSLLYMLIHCPEDMAYLVRAQINELCTRKSYSIIRSIKAECFR